MCPGEEHPHTKPLEFRIKSAGFKTKPFSALQNSKKDFVCEGSSAGHTKRTFKGFVDLKTRFSDSVHLGEHFSRFGKKPIFLECTYRDSFCFLPKSIQFFNGIRNLKCL